MDLAVAVAVLCAVLHVSGAVEGEAGVEYKGCFSSQLAESQTYYRVWRGMTWSQGLAVCADRRTDFLAVQQSNSSGGENAVFCGNDLDSSAPLEESMCGSCQEEGNRTCGGPGAVSLFNIKYPEIPFVNNTALYLLIAGELGIKKMVKGRPTSAWTIEPMVPNTKAVTTLDFLYHQDTLLFLTDTFYRSQYDYQTFSKLWVGNDEGVTSNSRLVVDWVRGELFWSVEEAEAGAVLRAGIGGGSATDRVVNTSSVISDLALDPYYRTLYYVTAEGDLFAFKMDSEETSKMDKYREVRSIAYDPREELLYLVGRAGQKRHSLLRTDREGSGEEVLMVSGQYNDWGTATGLDLAAGEVFWLQHPASDVSEIHRCWATSCQASNDFLTVRERISDVKVYHSEKQTPSDKFLCLGGGCSDGCVRKSLFAVSCACPEDKVLDSDKKTCVRKVKTEAGTSLR